MALSWNSLKAALRSDFIWRTLIFLVALAVLIVITTRWNRWEGNAQCQATDDAYLQADLTPIASKVAGYVRALPVQDFDRVRADQVLAEIVDDDYQAAVAQINAGIASAAAQLEALKAQRPLQEANVRAAKATVDSIAANVAQNARDFGAPGTAPQNRIFIDRGRGEVANHACAARRAVRTGPRTAQCRGPPARRARRPTSPG